MNELLDGSFLGGPERKFEQIASPSYNGRISPSPLKRSGPGHGHGKGKKDGKSKKKHHKDKHKHNHKHDRRDTDRGSNASFLVGRYKSEIFPAHLEADVC